MLRAKRCLPLVIGSLLLLAFLIIALWPEFFTSYGQKEMFRPWQPPSREHLLGTNALGYDIYTELIHGTGETLFIGVASSVLTLFLGTVIGLLSIARGIPGRFFHGLINVFVLLPKLITLIVLASFVGNSMWNLIALISVFSWVGIARNVRAKVIHLNSQTFIENCVIQGFDRIHIAIHHIIPNLYDVLISRFLLGVTSCMMMESTLSFLGFGDLYHPTWGTMINFAYKRGAFIRQAYNYLLTPGICIMLLCLAFYFISLFFESRKETIAEV